MTSYSDDPVQDHVREFMGITYSYEDNGDGNDVELDLESHVKVKKQAYKAGTNKDKGKEKGKAKRSPPHPTHLGDLQPGKRKRRS